MHDAGQPDVHRLRHIAARTGLISLFTNVRAVGGNVVELGEHLKLRRGSCGRGSLLCGSDADDLPTPLGRLSRGLPRSLLAWDRYGPASGADDHRTSM